MAYRNILLALAGKPEEKSVIRETMRLKKEFNAALSVIHVNDPAAGKAHMMMDSLPLHTEDDVRKWLRDAGVQETVDIIIASDESDADEIARTSHNFDLLIIGHHHKNKFLASITDSTDERVADKVLCPMLVVAMK